MKACRQCGETKPLTEFYTHKKMADGHLNKCKDCVKGRVAKHREANIDRIRAYDRERGFRGGPGHVAKYKAAHPERRAAQVAVSNAVRDGRLIPLPCFVCGEKAEAHHPDYDRPLDVVWLCPPHHKQAHALANKLMQQGE